MRPNLFSVFVLAILLAMVALASGQEVNRRGFPPDKEIESREGYPERADLIAHKHVAKGTHMQCLSVQSHPKHGDDGQACLIKVDGHTQRLNFHETTQMAADGEVYLECLGDRPTKCVLGFY